jgi:hypothetical protein
MPEDSHPRIVRSLVATPRWLLLLALVYAPWAYGCTRPWASTLLAVILSDIVLLWLLGCVVRRQFPAVPRLALVTVICLLAQGWWMALNAKSNFDPTLQVFLPKASFLSHRPGSVDERLSVSTMYLMTSLLGTLLFVMDLATRPRWCKRLWIAMACTGLSIALLGIIQKIGGEPVLSLIWEHEKIDLDNNFGMYRYRGNAGAYLNLVLPLICGLAVEAFRKRGSHWPRALWAAAIIIIIAAIQLNPSRAGWGIAFLIGFVAAVFCCWRSFRRSSLDATVLWRSTALAALFASALVALCWIGDWQTSWQRMSNQGINPSGRSPTEIYLAMAPDAGFLGFGPGTFQAAFPSYQLTYDFGKRTVPEFWTKYSWTHAHQDYLQTIIEWGYLGALLWGLLFVGGLYRGVLHLRTASRDSYGNGSTSPQHARLLACTLLALAGVLLHAWIDFPLQIASIQLYVAVLLGICWARS